jgi:hypothetical protein
MTEKPTNIRAATRLCPACKGTGLDKSAHRRYTTGGHDDRSCPRCNGECYLEDELIAPQEPEEGAA